MNKKGIILLTITAVLCIAGIIGYKMWNKPFPTLSSKDAIKVSASQLFTDFSTNEKAAQQKYVPEKLDSKTLEVSGEIKDTGQNADGEKFYILNGGDEMFGVKCIMDKGNEISDAKPGKQVVIRGFCTGYNMDVILNRCQQVK